MNNSTFSQRMTAFDGWKGQVAEALAGLQAWLEEQGLSDGETDLRILNAAESLRKDQLTIAVAAEFSRGKSELLNAIFFADHGRRLLPSEAGRTTMCPTELFYDKDGAYIKLLPIETRREQHSLGDLKQDPMYWSTIELDTTNPDQMASAFNEVVKTRSATIDEARALGLSVEGEVDSAGMVQIPLWRHAMISFPHPLLKQGLVILDTPGLNALGSEPELTLNMLPSAQAVIFLLSADTGVTRSDLDMWQHHIRGLGLGRRTGVAVALNKIDTLWDDLKDPATVEQGIEAQCLNTCKLLGINRESVFPVSAQKALLAKIRGTDTLLQQSRLPELEQYLADDVVPARQTLVQEHIRTSIGGLIQDTRRILEARAQEKQRELEELGTLSGRNSDVLQHLMKQSREEQAAYTRNLEAFQAHRQQLNEQADNVMQALSLNTLDRLIGKSRKTMSRSWTTLGLKRAMAVLFEGITDSMDEVMVQMEQTRTLIRATYQVFHDQHGLPDLTPKPFTMDSWREELQRLVSDAEAFRNSPVTAITEQHFVIQRFFITLVSHVRHLYLRMNRKTETWLKDAMNPLVSQLREHKKVLENRLASLRRISKSREDLRSRMDELKKDIEETATQIGRLEDTMAVLDRPLPPVQAPSGTPTIEPMRCAAGQ